MQVLARLDGGSNQGDQFIREKVVILLKQGTVPPKNSGKELRFLDGIPVHHVPGQEGSQEGRQHGLPKIKFLLEQPLHLSNHIRKSIPIQRLQVFQKAKNMIQALLLRFQILLLSLQVGACCPHIQCSSLKEFGLYGGVVEIGPTCVHQEGEFAQQFLS